MLGKTAVALAGAALMAVTGTSAAQAETPWCTGGDLVISAHRMNKPSANKTQHWMRFAPAPGASCKIGGTLANVRFFDETGRDMNLQVSGGEPGEFVELPVGGIHEAAAYVISTIQGPQVFPAVIQFDLPGQDGRPGERAVVAWPSGIGPLVQMGNLRRPAD